MAERLRSRPYRRFPDAKRVIVECKLECCVHCGQRLVNRNTWHMRKYVQTLQGPLFVAGKSKRCANSCGTHHDAHYYASDVLLISLPYSTYGLDVLAFIGWQHEHKHRQLVEIQGLLQARGLLINERTVGKLYRQFLALLGGMQADQQECLRETGRRYGGLIWALDALQPEGDGALLYVLYEVLSGTPVQAITLTNPTAERLKEGIAPYKDWPFQVLATLSDGEKAIGAALKESWPTAAHQLCQLHFLNNVAQPAMAEDALLRQRLRDSLGGLPRVPEGKPVASARERDEQEGPLFCPPSETGSWWR